MRITKHYFIIKSIFDFESQNLPFSVKGLIYY